MHLCAVPPLHRAAFYASTNKLRKLLKAGADVNARDPMNGYTAIHFACLEGNLSCASILIEFHADLSMLGHDGRGCLHVVTGKGGPNLVKLLLKHGAKKLLTTNLLGEAPLHTACGHGKADLARLFLNAGAAPETLDKEEFSPFHRAAHQGKAAFGTLWCCRG